MMTFGSATVIKAFQGAELLSRLRIDRKMCPEFIPWQRRPTRSCLSSIALFVVESLTEGSSSGRQDWFGARKRKSCLPEDETSAKNSTKIARATSELQSRGHTVCRLPLG